MTTATGLGPLPEVLQAREGRKAVREVFAAEGVPLALIDDRTHRLPLATMAAIFDHAARRVGDGCFGLEVGARMAPGEYGLWTRYAMQAPTLGDALMRVAQTLQLHQSGTAMRIAPREAGRVAWEYRYAGVGAARYGQHADHVVPVMIRLVQAYCGSDWTPRRVEVGYPTPCRAADREGATGAPWLFGQPCQAIVMDISDLEAKLPRDAASRTGPLVSLADVLATASGDASDEPLGDIFATVALRLLEGQSDIEGTAEMLGCGRRKIQRRLEDEGLSYRALVTRVRMRRARDLVEASEHSLKRIGLELGYADPAHFTRAFSQYFGFPPSRLRDRPDRAAHAPAHAPTPAHAPAPGAVSEAALAPDPA